MCQSKAVAWVKCWKNFSFQQANRNRWSIAIRITAFSFVLFSLLNETSTIFPLGKCIRTQVAFLLDFIKYKCMKGKKWYRTFQNQQHTQCIRTHIHQNFQSKHYFATYSNSLIEHFSREKKTIDFQLNRENRWKENLQFCIGIVIRRVQCIRIDRRAR